MQPSFRLHICIALLAASTLSVCGQRSLDQILPVRGFCIGAPSPDRLDEFIQFIDKELAPRSVNTLILRVDFNFQYTSHPELGNKAGLSKSDVGQLVAVCRKHKIRLIPQINLLGHQSWQKIPGNLLRVYPEFDETPNVKFPDKYSWPNPDRLYCKSYCPLHPKVHDVVFPLVDEICDAFEADAFHAGMDEVFYIGEDQCSRCAGKDKAVLFSNEVKLIRDHLNAKNRQLWIWGDRLLDGRATGLGEWEASQNNTDRAIDLVPKDVMICDWHYERPDPTAVYFAMKGLNVVTCPWTNPTNAVRQVQDMVNFREHSAPAMKDRFRGVVQTVWSGAGSFLDHYYGRRKEEEEKRGNKTESKCFVKMFEEVAAIQQK